MTAKNGIELFGETAIRALVTEFGQLDRVKCFKLRDPETITNDQKEES